MCLPAVSWHRTIGNISIMRRSTASLLILAVLLVGVYSAAIEGPIDFYKLYDNPEAHISLKGKATTVGSN